MIIPMHDNVLVQVFSEEEKRVGSIIVTDSMEREYSRGKVLAVGPGSTEGAHPEYSPMQSQVDDLVIFRRGAGVAVGGLVLIKDRDVLAKDDQE